MDATDQRARLRSNPINSETSEGHTCSRAPSLALILPVNLQCQCLYSLSRIMGLVADLLSRTTDTRGLPWLQCVSKCISVCDAGWGRVRGPHDHARPVATDVHPKTETFTMTTGARGLAQTCRVFHVVRLPIVLYLEIFIIGVSGWRAYSSRKLIWNDFEIFRNGPSTTCFTKAKLHLWPY